MSLELLSIILADDATFDAMGEAAYAQLRDEIAAVEARIDAAERFPDCYPVDEVLALYETRRGMKAELEIPCPKRKK